MKRIFFAIFFGLAFYGAVHHLPFGNASGGERVKLDSYKYDYGDKARALRSEQFVISDDYKKPPSLTLFKKVAKKDRPHNRPEIPRLKTPAQRIKEIKAILAPHEVVVYFGFGSSALAPLEKKNLDRFAETAHRNDRYTATGYTCDIGTKERNELVARRRANTVAEYLTNSGLIVNARAKPKCCYVDLVRKELNRRVEVTLASSGDKQIVRDAKEAPLRFKPEAGHVVETVYFDFNSRSLTAETERQLDQFIKQTDRNEIFRVIGYSGGAGSKRGNEIVAELRSETVAWYLSKNGLNVVAHYGHANCCYVDGVNGSRNRRAEIEIINKPNNEGENL